MPEIICISLWTGAGYKSFRCHLRGEGKQNIPPLKIKKWNAMWKNTHGKVKRLVFRRFAICTMHMASIDNYKNDLFKK